MASLTGQTIANSYKDLLQVSNSNSGVDGTIRIVEDGEGTSSALKIGTGGIESSGTLTVAGVTTMNNHLYLNATLHIPDCCELEGGGDALFNTAIILQNGGLEVNNGSGQIAISLGADVENTVGGVITLKELPSDVDDPNTDADTFNIFGRDDNKLYFSNNTGDPYKILHEGLQNMVFTSQVTFTDSEESDALKIGFLISDPATQGTEILSDHGNLWFTCGDAKIRLKSDDSGNKRVIFDGTYGTLHQSPLEMDTGQNILVSSTSKIKDSVNGDEWIKLNDADGIQIKSEGVGELYIESLDCKLEIADVFTVDCNEGIFIRDFAGTSGKSIKISADDPSAIVVRKKSTTAFQLYDEASNLMLNYNTNWDAVSGPYTAPSDTGVLDIGKLVVGNLDGASLGARTLPNDNAQVRINLRSETAQAFTIFNDSQGDNIYQINTDDQLFLFDETGSGWKFAIGVAEPQGTFHVKDDDDCEITFEAGASNEIRMKFDGSGSDNGIYFDNSDRSMTFQSGGDTLTKIQTGDGIQKQEQDGNWYQLLSRGFFFQTFVHNCDAYTISSGDFNLIPWTANGNMVNSGASGISSSTDVAPEHRFLNPYSSMRLVKIVVQPEDNTCTSYPTTVELRFSRRIITNVTTANPNNSSSIKFQIGSWTTAPDGIGNVPPIVWEQDIGDMEAYAYQDYTQGMQIIMELIVNGTVTNNNGWLISTVWAIKF
tara:strand:+ start:1690 stop:3828 length:2139 start_codon:yes stop_codon:yes gene_type:complete